MGSPNEGRMPTFYGPPEEELSFLGASPEAIEEFLGREGIPRDIGGGDHQSRHWQSSEVFGNQGDCPGIS